MGLDRRDRIGTRPADSHRVVAATRLQTHGLERRVLDRPSAVSRKRRCGQLVRVVVKQPGIVRVDVALIEHIQDVARVERMIDTTHVDRCQSGIVSGSRDKNWSQQRVERVRRRPNVERVRPIAAHKVHDRRGRCSANGNHIPAFIPTDTNARRTRD